MDIDVLLGRLVGTHLVAWADALNLQLGSITVPAGLFETQQVVLELFLAQLSELYLVLDLLVHVLVWLLGTRGLNASSKIVELIHELAELGLVRWKQ